MTVTKWVMDDPESVDSWTFLRNPFSMQSPTSTHRTRVMPGGLAIRGGRLPFQWSFQGNVRSRGEYETLLAWSEKPNAIRITDHLGRTHEVIPQQLDAVPRRTRQGQHWRFTYTFKTLYVQRVTP